MATSTEIKQRANALADKTDVNSITPKEVGGIMYDLASHSENVLRNGGTLGIRKVYESVSAMEADSTNPKDFWGDPIKKGNLVVIYDGTTTGVDNNKIYAFMKPGWELATKLDAAYATKAETDAKLSELGSEVDLLGIDMKVKPVVGIQYTIEPYKTEANTLYHTDGTTVAYNGYNAETYILGVGEVVKIQILKDFPTTNLAVVAYKNSEDEFRTLLVSPLEASSQADLYVTITNEFKELIVVGCSVVGIDVNYSPSSKDYVDNSIKDDRSFLDLVPIEIKDGYVNSINEDIESRFFSLYKFEIRESDKLKLYFASGGGRALFVDSGNNVIGDAFQSNPVGNDYYQNTWKEVDVPEGASVLKLSQVKKSSDYHYAYPCRALGNKQNIDGIKKIEEEVKKNADNIMQVNESIVDERNFIDLLYDSKKEAYIDGENVEHENKFFYLYEFDIKGSTRLKLYFASGGGRALFVDVNGDIVGEPFKSNPVGNDHFQNTWNDIEIPNGAVLLKLSQVKQSESYPNAYPCRVIANRQNYDVLASSKIHKFNKTMINVGMSIWWMDGGVYDGSVNPIDGNGVLKRGYQTLLQEVFSFNDVVKYAYSGFSLGVGDSEKDSIMASKASTWENHNNAIWTLDTITNDFGRMVPLGVPSDFDNNTGINTFYGALRAFKNKVEELSPGVIVVCSNALYRTKKTNSLNLTLEDYETAMCYAAAKSGWYFVDQYRTSINEANVSVALYDGLHPTNFGFRLAVKPWIEQFRILNSIL